MARKFKVAGMIVSAARKSNRAVQQQQPLRQQKSRGGGVTMHKFRTQLVQSLEAACATHALEPIPSYPTGVSKAAATGTNSHVGAHVGEDSGNGSLDKDYRQVFVCVYDVCMYRGNFI